MDFAGTKKEPQGPFSRNRRDQAKPAIHKPEWETRLLISAYLIDLKDIFYDPLCLMGWVAYDLNELGKCFLITPTPLQVLVFWSKRPYLDLEPVRTGHHLPVLGSSTNPGSNPDTLTPCGTARPGVTVTLRDGWLSAFLWTT